jgi:hypothetical protein
LLGEAHTASEKAKSKDEYYFHCFSGAENVAAKTYKVCLTSIQSLSKIGASEKGLEYFNGIRTHAKIERP